MNKATMRTMYINFKMIFALFVLFSKSELYATDLVPVGHVLANGERIYINSDAGVMVVATPAEVNKQFGPASLGLASRVGPDTLVLSSHGPRSPQWQQHVLHGNLKKLMPRQLGNASRIFVLSCNGEIPGYLSNSLDTSMRYPDKLVFGAPPGELLYSRMDHSLIDANGYAPEDGYFKYRTASSIDRIRLNPRMQMLLGGSEYGVIHPKELIPDAAFQLPNGSYEFSAKKDIFNKFRNLKGSCSVRINCGCGGSSALAVIPIDIPISQYIVSARVNAGDSYERATEYTEREMFLGGMALASGYGLYATVGAAGTGLAVVVPVGGAVIGKSVYELGQSINDICETTRKIEQTDREIERLTGHEVHSEPRLFGQFLRNYWKHMNNDIIDEIKLLFAE